MSIYVTIQEENALLLPLLQNIVAQLNLPRDSGKWTLEPQDRDEPSREHKIRSGDALLWIHKSQYTKDERLNISGVLPRGKDGQYVRAYDRGPEGKDWTEVRVSDITVAISRGPAAIAKEITRRFLPDYLKAVTLVLHRIAEDEAYESKRLANLQACAAKLAIVLSVPYQKNRLEDRTEFSEYLGKGCSGIRIEVKASDHDVDLKIDNLTVEQAQQVLALVKKLGGKQ